VLDARGADDDVGLAQVDGRSRVPVCVRVTVALTARRVSSSPIERPIVTPRPTTTTCVPARAKPLRSSSSITARGVHGSGEVISSLTLSTSLPRLVGCRPSASFAGSIRSRMRSVSMPQRQLHDVAVAGRVGVEAIDRASTSACVASAGSSTWIEFMPIASDSRCFIPTYSCDAGSAPTSTVAMPG
jgi:hypothetical protein